jgi:maleylacetoacetate isomerase
VDFKLYSYYRSSCSYRVRIALEYKKIQYTYIPIHLLQNGGEQNTEGYSKLNTKKEVPTLTHQDFHLSQSMAIIEYLDEALPKPQLFLGDAKQKAKIRQACELINSGIQPLQNLRVLNKLASDFKIDELQKTKWVVDHVQSGLAALESFLSSHSGQFCFGDSITAADLFLIPQLYNAERYKMDITLYKQLSKINKNCLQLESFIKAHPDQQPDAPK